MINTELKDANVKSVPAATVGSVAVQLQEKASNDTHSIIDQTQQQISEYYDNLIKCYKENKSKYQGDFYIVVLTKKERLLENVVRNYFFARTTCPTPDYDQAVYKFDHFKEEINFVWVIPDKETCLMMINNTALIAPEEQQLLQFVIDYSTGKLFQLAKKLNGESLTSPILES
jgi:hypothetical protein